MAAVAFFYSNYLLLHWQLLILVVAGFFGSITFFMAETLAQSMRRESDYNTIWRVSRITMERSTAEQFSQMMTMLMMMVVVGRFFLGDGDDVTSFQTLPNPHTQI